MKKKNILIIIVLILVFAGVGFCVVKFKPIDKIFGKDKESKLHSYEVHAYDEVFKHTEEFIIKFDDDGNFKYLEEILVWTEKDTCDGFEEAYKGSPDLEYPDVKATCTVTDKGAKASFSMTDKSVKAGYLKDDKDWNLTLRSMYSDKLTVEFVQEAVMKNKDHMVEDGIKEDDMHYIIYDNERVHW